MRERFKRAIGTLCWLVLVAGPAWANNLMITNLTLEDRDPTNDTAVVQFDISWDNSWRDSTNHDAVWLIFKMCDTVAAKVWSHIDLEDSGLNPTGFSIGTSNVPLEAFIPSDKVGVFLRRKGQGTGGISATKVRIKLDYGSSAGNALADTDTVIAKAVGMEMVYIPEGPFFAGDGTSASRFGYDSSTFWYISSEGTIITSNTVSSANTVWYNTTSAGDIASAAIFTIPANFPKGYKAFYAMKYEITEGQWVDFINTIPIASANVRDLTLAAGTAGKGTDIVSSRNAFIYDSTSTSTTAVGYGRPASSPRPDRGMSYLSWLDVCAFLDWAGLRPMSELEYEKIARGPLAVVAGEMAWGTTAPTAAGTFSYSTEDGRETITTASANTTFGGTTFTSGDGGRGPVRAGLYATSSTSTRLATGGSYYGVMELSGNLWEPVVSVGVTTSALQFVGSHGDGQISTTGNADASWPTTSGSATDSALGSGRRGGSWLAASTSMRASDRTLGTTASMSRTNEFGGRGVRDCGGVSSNCSVDSSL